MKFTACQIPDVILIEPDVIGDDRGFFMETFRSEKFIEEGISAAFVQDNQSGSRQGTLRGLHYQIRKAQGKLMRAVLGEVYDVAVDLRRYSPTFGRWVGQRLSAENRRQLWIPPGFAHGFYVLSEWAEVFYKVTDYYAPEWERTVLWNDPQIGIEWPLVHGQPLILSEKDAGARPLSETEVYEERV